MSPRIANDVLRAIRARSITLFLNLPTRCGQFFNILRAASLPPFSQAQMSTIGPDAIEPQCDQSTHCESAIHAIRAASSRRVGSPTSQQPTCDKKLEQESSTNPVLIDQLLIEKPPLANQSSAEKKISFRQMELDPNTVFHVQTWDQKAPVQYMSVDAEVWNEVPMQRPSTNGEMWTRLPKRPLSNRMLW